MTMPDIRTLLLRTELSVLVEADDTVLADTLMEVLANCEELPETVFSVDNVEVIRQ